MNFDFSDEQKLLQQTARDYLAEHSPLSTCREILESDQAYAAPLWKGAAEMGWQGAVVPEEFGGAGFGYLELAMIAYEVGRALAPIPFGPSVFVATEAVLRHGSAAQKSAWLPKLANGSVIGTFAFAEKPGQNAVEAVAATVKDGKLSGVKMPVADGDVASLAVVAAKENGATGLYLVDLAGAGVSRKTLERPGRRRSATPAGPACSGRRNTAAAAPRPIERVIWQQEEGVYGKLAGIFLIGQGMCGPTLMAFAEERAQAALPAAAGLGRGVWCQLFSEPVAGSDLAGLRTKRRKGWRRLGHQRPEDLDQRRALFSDYGIDPHPHRPERAKHDGLTMFFST
jgi:alkylation response protein AidB-like acyl-CoA dehydrogenase